MEKKHNPFEADIEDLAITSSQELEEAKNAAGVVSLSEHIERLEQTGDSLLIKEAGEIRRRLAKGESTNEIIGNLDQEKIKEVWKNLKKVNVKAYGGNSYSLRVATDNISHIPAHFLGSRDGLSADRISYGIGADGNKRFVILRTLLDTQSRGGYPYSVLLDFDDEVWEKVNWNYALVIQKILENESLKLKILNQPESIRAEDFRSLADTDWAISGKEDINLNVLIEKASVSETQVLSQKDVSLPDPSVLARALQKLAQEKRKNFTFMIGSSRAWMEPAELKMVYDTNL